MMDRFVLFLIFLLMPFFAANAGGITQQMASDLFHICDRPYGDKPAPLKDTNRNVLIHRPNHGLAHAMRQRYLVHDILDVIIRGKSRLTDFVERKIETDRLFVRKLEVAAAFQRVGRESEAGSDQRELYRRYMQNSRRLFLEYFPRYFHGERDSELYSNAITHSSAGGNSDFVKRILDSVHLLDLVRMGGGVNRHSIVDRIHELLEIPREHALGLLGISDTYSRATGQGNHGDHGLFVRLSQNPKELVAALDRAR